MLLRALSGPSRASLSGPVRGSRQRVRQRSFSFAGAAEIVPKSESCTNRHFFFSEARLTASAVARSGAGRLGKVPGSGPGVRGGRLADFDASA